MSISSFFNPDDGLTVQAFLLQDSKYLTGYFDILDSEFYVDDGEAENRAEFVCESSEVPASVVGKTLQIDGADFRINKSKPDGAGVTTLVLMNMG